MPIRAFAEPLITTRSNRGPVALTYAFTGHARYDPVREEKGPRGVRIFRFLAGGLISGPRLNGELFPSGGDIALVRPDRVEDVNARFMIRAETGEWIYVEHSGYRRHADGYHRIAAFFDADRYGPYAWLNDNAVIATAEDFADGLSVTFTYYQVT